ncbi:substrate-binding domain-containing protein [Zhihengliuella salsuginis]|uniref:substrate-binding domain-containing protein n=1 Tax=Zhihengliuella salsuginis TaxID=578222 RepID=UPI001E4F6DCB|nr:substrate-binding domain-containing protein [Zhihengliuella salsuginis]
MAENGLRVAYVPGVTPGKWLDRWNERLSDPLEAVLYDGGDPLPLLADGSADLVFVRFPEGQSPARDTLNCIPLYTELPVVCAAKEHLVEAYDDEVPFEDIADETFLDPGDYPAEAGGTRMALEVVGTGAGLLVLPMSVARLYHRKDVVHRVLTGVPESLGGPTRIGLAWPRPDIRDPELEAALADPESEQAKKAALIEEFVGIVRGRKASSSRQPSVREREQAEAAKAQKRRQGADKAGAPKRGQKQNGKAAPKGARGGSGARGGPKRGGPKRGKRR